MPRTPSSLVFPPSHKAFSFADYKSYSGFIYTKGIYSLEVALPYSYEGGSPVSFPESIAL